MILFGSLIAYIAAILGANYVTTEYGMVPVGFGLEATAGTWLIGLLFILRDYIQDAIRESLSYRTSRTVYVPVIPGHPGGGYKSATQPLLVRPHDLQVAARMFGVILLGAALSFLVSDPFIAVASVAAFIVAETVDFAIYTPLRKRGYIRAAFASNLVGSLLDTVVFLWVAGFPIYAALTGQMVGKMAVTGIVILGVAVFRAQRKVAVTA